MSEAATQEEFHTDDDIYVRFVAVRDAQMALPQHSHQYGHHTFLAHGAVSVWKNGELWHERLEAPAMIYIERGVKHGFLTLEPGTTLCCIHNLHGKEMVSVLEEHDLLG